MNAQSNNQPRRGQDAPDRPGGVAGMPEARFFKALCDPTRLRILASLLAAREPRTVSEVAKEFPVDVSVVSRHLAILRDQGILVARRNGKEVRYSVDYGFMVSILHRFARAIEACCPSEECCTTKFR